MNILRALDNTIILSRYLVLIINYIKNKYYVVMYVNKYTFFSQKEMFLILLSLPPHTHH